MVVLVEELPLEERGMRGSTVELGRRRTASECLSPDDFAREVADVDVPVNRDVLRILSRLVPNQWRESAMTAECDAVLDLRREHRSRKCVGADCLHGAEVQTKPPVGQLQVRSVG